MIDSAAKGFGLLYVSSLKTCNLDYLKGDIKCVSHRSEVSSIRCVQFFYFRNIDV